MSATILYGTEESPAEPADSDKDSLWLSLPDLARVSGWELKPEGACRGGVCVPIPADRRGAFVRDADVSPALNLAELARLQGIPFVHDRATATWCFGEKVSERAARLASFEAPDFRLPDATGQAHSLRDHRGRRVFLVAWASW